MAGICRSCLTQMPCAIFSSGAFTATPQKRCKLRFLHRAFCHRQKGYSFCPHVAAILSLTQSCQHSLSKILPPSLDDVVSLLQPVLHFKWGWHPAVAFQTRLGPVRGRLSQAHTLNCQAPCVTNSTAFPEWGFPNQKPNVNLLRSVFFWLLLG